MDPLPPSDFHALLFYYNPSSPPPPKKSIEVSFSLSHRYLDTSSFEFVKKTKRRDRYRGKFVANVKFLGFSRLS